MKPHCILLGRLFCFAATGDARDIAGTEVPETLAAASVLLRLNGAGVRTKFFMDMYVGSLYLTQSRKDPGHIIRADELMAIWLQMLSNLITSEKIGHATREGFQNATGGATASLRDEIERFIAVFREAIVKNDIYNDLCPWGRDTHLQKRHPEDYDCWAFV